MKIEGAPEKIIKLRDSSDMIGDDVESAYGRVLFEYGNIKGGVGDRGKDFVTLNKDILPDFQIKSSWDGAISFFKESLRRGEFIPIAIGEPGTAREIIDSINQYGGWVGKDEPLRKIYLDKIKKVRDTIQSGVMAH